MTATGMPAGLAHRRAQPRRPTRRRPPARSPPSALPYGSLLPRRSSSDRADRPRRWRRRSARRARGVRTCRTRRRRPARRAGRAGRAAAGGRGVGVDREQHQGAGRSVARVDAGRGQHQAVPGLDDPQRPAARDGADRLGVDRGLAARPSSTTATLGLAHHLARHHHDVAVAQAVCTRAAIRAARSSPSVTSPMPSSGRDVEAGHAPRTRSQRQVERRAGDPAAAAASSVISSGRARTCTPPARRAAGVAVVDQPAVEQPAGTRGRSAGHRAGRGLDADRAQARVGHAAHRGAADDRGHAHHRCARRRPTRRGCRAPQDRADAHHRVGRREQHDVGVGDGVEDAGRRLGLARRRRSTNSCAGTGACRRTHHSWKCTARRPGASGRRSTTCVSTGSSLIGSSRTPGCQRCAQRRR